MSLPINERGLSMGIKSQDNLESLREEVSALRRLYQSVHDFNHLQHERNIRTDQEIIRLKQIIHALSHKGIDE